MRLVQAGSLVVCHFSVYDTDGITHLPGQAGLCVASLWVNGGVSAVPVAIVESGFGYYASFTPTAGSWHLEIFDPNNTRWGEDIQAGPYTTVYCHFSVFAADGYTKVTGQDGACTPYLWEDGVVSAVPIFIGEVGVSGEYYASFPVSTVSDLWHIEVADTALALWQDDIEPNIGFGTAAGMPIVGTMHQINLAGTVAQRRITGVVDD